MRLVNSAGVSRGWEGTLGTEAQRSHIQRGHGKGPTRGSLPSFHVFCVWLFGPLPHPSGVWSSLWAQPRAYGGKGSHLLWVNYVPATVLTLDI